MIESLSGEGAQALANGVPELREHANLCSRVVALHRFAANEDYTRIVEALRLTESAAGEPTNHVPSGSPTNDTARAVVPASTAIGMGNPERTPTADAPESMPEVEDSGEHPDGFIDQLKNLRQSQELRITTEQRLRNESTEQLEAAQAALLAEAEEAWVLVQEIVEGRGPEADQALRVFVERYQGAKVEAGGACRMVEVSEVQAAKSLLAQLEDD